MTINIKLSTESIDHAISRLMDVEEAILFGADELVDILTNDAADVATQTYDGMAVATAVVDGSEGTVIASGEAVGFAEFGAGDDVIPVMFENSPDFPVYSGSYSESPEGTGEYAEKGYWHFGGRKYYGVPARPGLLMAKEYVEVNAPIVAQEVIRLR